MLDARQNGRVADLVAVEVQDRQHGSVANWVEKLVRLPCGRQRASFRFTVADDAGDDELGIVERRPEGMAKRVPQLAAFVNRPRRRRRNMARNPAGKRELREQLFQPGFVLADVRVKLTVGAFEVSIAHQRRAAVTGTGDVEHIQVILGLCVAMERKRQIGFFYSPLLLEILAIFKERRVPLAISSESVKWYRPKRLMCSKASGLRRRMSSASIFLPASYR